MNSIKMLLTTVLIFGTMLTGLCQSAYAASATATGDTSTFTVTVSATPNDDTDTFYVYKFVNNAWVSDYSWNLEPLKAGSFSESFPNPEGAGTYFIQVQGIYGEAYGLLTTNEFTIP